eukprot:TRINITY_DN5540_c0_g1_i5.p1 TRINITY_DN5540_c0_g1~~TRINITY_DN5540_c0_g1_i5.p1  ORF type:complete len:209 (-),score=32.82 TRINITY_DN5540_c0_g1_i5:711-1337(-)
MDMIGGYEPTSGFEFARYRGDFLTGFGMLLNQALIQYAIQFLHKKGYTAVQTPSLVKESIMKKLLPLVEFEESLYKIHGNANDEPLSLVSTSAHPLCAFNMGCTLVDSDLPMKYASATTCFRKKSRQGDAGHVFGIHRQSERIELFVFSNPDQSWDTHEEIIRVFFFPFFFSSLRTWERIRMKLRMTGEWNVRLGYDEHETTKMAGRD